VAGAVKLAHASDLHRSDVGVGEIRLQQLTNLDDLPQVGGLNDSPRGRVLRAAAYLFHLQGYSRTTVREIAQVVGIQSGSLFHHFKTKEDILCAVMT